MKDRGASILGRAVVVSFTVAALVLSASATIHETVLHAFDPNPGGIFPESSLISDAAGNLYGTTMYGGTYNVGTVFELSPRSGGGWTQKVLYKFKKNGADGISPNGSVIFDAHGNLYGTTSGGGAHGGGTVFELAPNQNGTWTETVLHSFNDNGTDGYFPVAGLVGDSNGNFYGTTVQGGTYDAGTVFELTPGDGGDWTETVLHSFGSGTDGDYPEASLIFDAHGNLYSTTEGGGAGGYGTVFELSPAQGGSWTETVLYSFHYNGSDGVGPQSALVFDAHGNLYGTTYGGGLDGEGTVFQLTPGHPWTAKVLYNFSDNPNTGSLIVDSQGNLYGTALYGGHGVGSVFELSPGPGGSWVETALYSFNNNGTDGAYPDAGLLFDTAGNLYGTTVRGGGSDYDGTIFELSPRHGGGWTETVLYSFTFDGTDGIDPLTGLIFDTQGNLYGTTYGSGTHDYGTVFELSHGSGGWTETLLHNFNNDGADGIYPYGTLISDANGNLYGTTYEGGAHGYGTVFKLSSGSGGNWTETVLHSFGSGTDGTYPYAGLIIDSVGNLYGTTYHGGANAGGTVFELSPGNGGSWTETILHSFGFGAGGVYPEAGLIFDHSGNLYGTTYLGGEYGSGTVFELSPGQGGSWTETILHSFHDNGTDAAYPQAGLVFDAHGNLYSTTLFGGTSYVYGTVFELSPGLGGSWTETILHSFNYDGRDGLSPHAGVVLDTHGNVYGTTYSGGTYGYGTVFELSPGQGGSWTETILHSFIHNGTDGLQPQAGLIVDDSGNLYGTTTGGGTYEWGTVFEVSP
jgi:uncharacterized repeat protein (TIGR03803 family)